MKSNYFSTQLGFHIFSCEYPTHAKRGEQETCLLTHTGGHARAHPTSPSRPHFSTASQTQREAWDQPPLMCGHQQHGQRRCLPPWQKLQATLQWQIPISPLKTGPVRKRLYHFHLASCLGIGTDWYSHGDHKKKKEGSPLSFSAHNFVSRFCHLIRKTVPRRKKPNIFNSISSSSVLYFPPETIPLLLSDHFITTNWDAQDEGFKI